MWKGVPRATGIHPWGSASPKRLKTTLLDTPFLTINWEDAIEKEKGNSSIQKYMPELKKTERSDVVYVVAWYLLVMQRHIFSFLNMNVNVFSNV